MPSLSIEQLILEEESATEEETSQSILQAAISHREFGVFTWTLILTSLLSSAFIFGFDQTVTADVQQSIGTTFDSSGLLHWISVPFMLGTTVGRLLWMKLYSNFQDRDIYISAIIVFGLGSTLCAAAPSMPALITGRAICGVGGSGMYIGAMKLVHQTTAKEGRSRFLGISSLIWGLATILGPIVGDAFAFAAVGWRFSFCFNLIVSAAFTPILFKLPTVSRITYFRLTPLQISKWAQENDLIGQALLSAIYVTGLIAAVFGGIVYDWTDYWILLLLISCGFLGIIYSIQQTYRLTQNIQLIPKSESFQCLKNPMVLFLILAECCAATGIFITIYFVPLYFQILEGNFILLSSIHLLPFLASSLIMIPVSSAIVTRQGNIDVAPWLFGFGGLLLLTGGTLIAATDTSDSSYPNSRDSILTRYYAATVLIGVGAGSYIQLPFTTLSTDSPQGRSTTDFISYAQLAVPAIMLSFAYLFYANSATECLIELLPNLPAAEIYQFAAGVSADFPNGSQESVKQCVGASVRKVFIGVAVAGGLTVVGTLLMSVRRRLR